MKSSAAHSGNTRKTRDQEKHSRFARMLKSTLLRHAHCFTPQYRYHGMKALERETGFEPATHCLGSNCATTAPLPRNTPIVPHNQPLVKWPRKVPVALAGLERAQRAWMVAHAGGSEETLEASHGRRIGTTWAACMAWM